LLLVQAVDARDFPVVQAALLVASVAFVLMNLVVDLTYSAVDPRVRIR
jgi:peptide/nickel transport system permease protein